MALLPVYPNRRIITIFRSYGRLALRIVTRVHLSVTQVSFPLANRVDVSWCRMESSGGLCTSLPTRRRFSSSNPIWLLRGDVDQHRQLRLGDRQQQPAQLNHQRRRRQDRRCRGIHKIRHRHDDNRRGAERCRLGPGRFQLRRNSQRRRLHRPGAATAAAVVEVISEPIADRGSPRCRRGLSFAPDRL